MGTEAIELRGIELARLGLGSLAGLSGKSEKKATLADLLAQLKRTSEEAGPRKAKMVALMQAKKLTREQYDAYRAWVGSVLDLYFALLKRIRKEPKIIDAIARETGVPAGRILNEMENPSFPSMDLTPQAREGLGLPFLILIPVIIKVVAVVSVAGFMTAVLTSSDRAAMTAEREATKRVEKLLAAGLTPEEAAKIEAGIKPKGPESPWGAIKWVGIGVAALAGVAVLGNLGGVARMFSRRPGTAGLESGEARDRGKTWRWRRVRSSREYRLVTLNYVASVKHDGTYELLDRRTGKLTAGKGAGPSAEAGKIAVASEIMHRHGRLRTDLSGLGGSPAHHRRDARVMLDAAEHARIATMRAIGDGNCPASLDAYGQWYGYLTGAMQHAKEYDETGAVKIGMRRDHAARQLQKVLAEACRRSRGG